jgi:hypothetical protein
MSGAKSLWVVLFLLWFYVATSLLAYWWRNPQLTQMQILRYHVVDALYWREAPEKERPLRGWEERDRRPR